jgi:hypothetical protein
MVAAAGTGLNQRRSSCAASQFIEATRAALFLVDDEAIGIVSALTLLSAIIRSACSR